MATARRAHNRQRHGGHLRFDPGDVRDRGLAEHESSDSALIGVTVLVTGVVVWWAHACPRAGGVARPPRMLNRRVRRRDFGTTGPWWNTVPLVLIPPWACRRMPDRAAILAARLAALVESWSGGYDGPLQGGVPGTTSSPSAPTADSAVVLLGPRPLTARLAPRRSRSAGERLAHGIGRRPRCPIPADR